MRTDDYEVWKRERYSLTRLRSGRTRGHRHVNGEDELYKCLNGSGQVIQVMPDGERIINKFEQDDRVMIRPYAFHYVINIGNEPLEFMTSGPECEKDYTRVE